MRVSLLPGKADYGHAIKSLWMIYHTGQLVKDESLVNFAKTNAGRLLQEGYDADSGTWTSAPFLDENGKVVRNLDKKWWIYAELDQVAGTLSLEEPSYAEKYLRSTVNWWFDNMVDQTNHGVGNLLIWPTLEKQLPSAVSLEKRFSQLRACFSWLYYFCGDSGRTSKTLLCS